MGWAPRLVRPSARRPSCDGGELRHSKQVVRGGDHVGSGLIGTEPDVARLPKAADRLDPAEDLLDALPYALTDGVSRRTRRPSVDYRSTMLGDVLGDVRRDVPCAALGDEVAGVVELVAAEREYLSARPHLSNA